MSQLKWAAFAVIPSVLLTFVGAYVFLIAHAENEDAGTDDAAITITKDDETSPAKAPHDPEAPKPANPDGKLAPAVQRNPLFLKRLTLPQENNPNGTAADKDYFAHALCLDPTGTRLIAVSQTNTYCFDIPSGKVLQTFHNELPTNNARPQYIAASPDARFVIVGSVDGKEVTLREAATGQLIGTARLNEGNKSYRFLLESHLPAITPAEDYLLIGAGVVTPNALHVLSTKTGAQKLIDVPQVDLSKKDYEYLLPVPQSSTFLVYGTVRVDKSNPANLFVVDFSTGKETPLSCLRATPLFHDWRSMVLSPDGNLLLVKGVHALDICDWRANRLLFHYTEGSAHFDHACFTPDGKRVAFIDRENDHVIYMRTDPQTGKTTSYRLDDVIHLFDIARQEKIASFTPHTNGLGTHVRALTISHDGKSFAVWTDSEITVVDFQSAFGVAPLPPSQRLQGPESLPLKPLPDKKETPRKPK